MGQLEFNSMQTFYELSEDKNLPCLFSRRRCSKHGQPENPPILGGLHLGHQRGISCCSGFSSGFGRLCIFFLNADNLATTPLPPTMFRYDTTISYLWNMWTGTWRWGGLYRHLLLFSWLSPTWKNTIYNSSSISDTSLNLSFQGCGMPNVCIMPCEHPEIVQKVRSVSTSLGASPAPDVSPSWRFVVQEGLTTGAGLPGGHIYIEC